MGIIHENFVFFSEEVLKLLEMALEWVQRRLRLSQEFFAGLLALSISTLAHLDRQDLAPDFSKWRFIHGCIKLWIYRAFPAQV